MPEAMFSLRTGKKSGRRRSSSAGGAIVAGGIHGLGIGLAVAKRLGLTLPIVVLDDRWLALIKVKQLRRKFPLYGTELQEEEYREPPSHYFGVPAHGVRSAEALEDAVKTALAADGPTVIEAAVDSEHYIDTVYD